MAAGRRLANGGAQYFRENMETINENVPKRKRINTGGASGSTEPTKGLPYAQAAMFDVSTVSDSEKLNFLCSKMAAVETLTLEMSNVKNRLNEACDFIEELGVKMCNIEDRFSRQEVRLIDLEARSRRNNLLFTGIEEPDNETNEACEATLLDFLKNYMQLGDMVDGIVFHRVHRLGKKRRGVTSNGDPWKPRHIIAGFRDFKVKEFVLSNSKVLKGTIHTIQQDYPQEIRSARGKLWNEYCQARANKLRASIAYPAKLIVEGKLVRDELPEWNNRFGGSQTTPVNAMQQAPANQRTTLGDYIRPQQTAPLSQNPAPPTSNQVPGTMLPQPQRENRRNHTRPETNIDHAPLSTYTPSHPPAGGAKPKDGSQSAINRSHVQLPQVASVPHDQPNLPRSPMVACDPFGGPLPRHPLIPYDQPLCPLPQSPVVARDQLPHQPMVAPCHPHERLPHTPRVAHDQSQGQLPHLHMATESGLPLASDAGSRESDDVGTPKPVPPTAADPKTASTPNMNDKTKSHADPVLVQPRSFSFTPNPSRPADDSIPTLGQGLSALADTISSALQLTNNE